MKFKNFIALCALLLVLFASIGITTANENTTVESFELNAETNLIDNTEKIASESEGPSYYDYEDDYNYEDEYDAKIIDTTEYYTEDENEHILDYEDQLITFKVENDYGYIDDTYVSLYDEKGNYYEAWWDEDAEYYWFENKLPAGAHEITVFLDDEYYTAESLTYSVFVEKSYFYGTVTCKSYYGTTSDTLTMKATVKDSYDYREDGTVTFKVNGKSYTVKTKNGVATKTIKIKKAGTYTYTATFKSGNYIDKGVGKAKLYVYSTSKKARTFKIKSYKVVMPLTKYKKFIKAKNANKLITFSLKTNKYFKQKVGNSKYNLKTVKTRVIFLFSYGGKNGGQYGYPNKFSMCLTTKYQNPGWDYCTPWIYGAKKSSSINKLNSAKTTRW
ncbi:MAG: Ig-like domain repeat protein [Methanobrevibacter sp.]|nr:Ig-like domain-containing protein [Methanobrevibacter sp.]MBE6490959.1 Ig-like domain repeat protein [Methanobrevibacter sp.]